MIKPLAQAHEVKRMLQEQHFLSAEDERALLALELAKTVRATGEWVIAAEIAQVLGAKTRSRGVALSCGLLAAHCDLDRGRYVQAAEQLRELLASVDDALPTQRKSIAARIEIHLAFAELRLNLVSEADARLRRVYSSLVSEPDSENLGWCACNLGNVSLWKGDLRRAEQHYHEAIVSARRTGATELMATALRNLGMVQRQVCRWGTAEESFQESIQLWENLEHRANACHVQHAHAVLAWKRGRLAEVERSCSANLETSNVHGLRDVITWTHLLKAVLAVHAGDFQAARLRLSEASQSNDTPDFSRPSLLIGEYLGDVQLEQGKAAEALKHYDEVWPKALALVPKGDIVAELRRRRAECYLLLGRKEDAYKASKEALEHCRELGDRYEEAATYRVLALSAAAMDKPDEAQKHFTQGFAYFDDIETPYEWGKLWMSYGDWLNGPNAGPHADRIAAREAYVAARDHFAHMGARAKLREAEARLAALDAVAKPVALAPTTAPGVAPTTIRSAKRRPAAQVRLDARSEWAWNTFYMITRHEPLLNVLERAMKLAPARVPTLITGETGTGKELIAAAIHRYSKVTGHYISLNCAAVPRDMIESEMFGHVRGAFSGAVVERVGMVEAAANGTLFLDEVGEMSEAMQAKLLRFLESGEYRRVGESTNRHVATHVVAATNVPLEKLSRSESFRGDLYWRLAQGLIEVPALRHRPGDAGLLVDHFLRIESKKMGKPDLALTDSARAALLEYRWPGNVRELVGVVRRAVALAEHAIEVEHLELGSAREVAVTLTEELAEAERTRIENAMREHGNSPTSAARALGIPRTTLIMKLKRLGVRERLATPKPPAE